MYSLSENLAFVNLIKMRSFHVRSNKFQTIHVRTHDKTFVKNAQIRRLWFYIACDFEKNKIKIVGIIHPMGVKPLRLYALDKAAWFYYVLQTTYLCV